MGQQRGDIEEFLQRFGSDDSTVAEQRVNDCVACGEGAGMRRRRPGA
jgi:hypothetical protein